MVLVLLDKALQVALVLTHHQTIRVVVVVVQQWLVVQVLVPLAALEARVLTGSLLALLMRVEVVVVFTP